MRRACPRALVSEVAKMDREPPLGSDGEADSGPPAHRDETQSCPSPRSPFPAAPHSHPSAVNLETRVSELSFLSTLSPCSCAWGSAVLREAGPPSPFLLSLPSTSSYTAANLQRYGSDHGMLQPLEAGAGGLSPAQCSKTVCLNCHRFRNQIISHEICIFSFS